MLSLILITAVSAFLGGLAGSVVVLLLRDLDEQPEVDQPDWLDPELTDQINRAARDWAVAHGRPEAEGLVADKLRLGSALHQTRTRRRWYR